MWPPGKMSRRSVARGPPVLWKRTLISRYIPLWALCTSFGKMPAQQTPNNITYILENYMKHTVSNTKYTLQNTKPTRTGWRWTKKITLKWSLLCKKIISIKVNENAKVRGAYRLGRGVFYWARFGLWGRAAPSRAPTRTVDLEAQGGEELMWPPTSISPYFPPRISAMDFGIFLHRQSQPCSL